MAGVPPQAMLLFFLTAVAPLAVQANTLQWVYADVLRRGPRNWGTMGTPTYTYPSCNNRATSRQSPIDIKLYATSPLPQDLITSGLQCTPLNASVSNVGSTIMAQPAQGGCTMQYEGETFKLSQLHFHAPAEHTINGKRYDMEMHLVHRSDNGKLLVIGVLYEVGLLNSSFLNPLWSSLPAFPLNPSDLYATPPISFEPTRTAAPKEVDVLRALPAIHDFVLFDGSLTTPPCTEGVKWIVLTKPVQMSRAQLLDFREALRLDEQLQSARKHGTLPPLPFEPFGNARTTQPLNGRRVQYYKLPEFVESEQSRAFMMVGMVLVGLTMGLMWFLCPRPRTHRPVRDTPQEMSIETASTE